MAIALIHQYFALTVRTPVICALYQSSNISSE